MIPFRAEDITAEHINQLIANEVREGRTVEYKLKLPGGTDVDKKEFLADVSSFANGGGGDLIYGVAADKGVPTRAIGLGQFDPDGDILRLESSLRDGVDPRIPGIRFKTIDGLEEGPGLLIRVPNSWAGPHMVTFKNSSRFWARGSAGKFQMDVAGLRSAFALSGDLPERIRNWRNERIAKILANDTPVATGDGPRMVLHVIPASSFAEPYRVTAEQLAALQSKAAFPPISASGFDRRLNLDGILTYCGASATEPSVGDGYCQLFRSGRIEAVQGSIIDTRHGDKQLGSQWYERVLLEATAEYLSGLASVGIAPPLVVHLTLLGVKGVRLAVDIRRLVDPRPIDRDMLFMPELLVSEPPKDLPRIMRPTFDAVWNACGILRSLNFDSAGNWAAGPLRGVPLEVSASS